MTGQQDTFPRMVIVLAVICAAAGLTLGATYHLTQERIRLEQERGRMRALRVVLPEAHANGFREVTAQKSSFAADGRYYEAYDKPLADASRKLVGYALEGAGAGYSSTIRVTVGVDPKGEIVRGIKITSQQETPGLGSNCEAVKSEGTLWDALFGKARQSGEAEPWFQAQFRGQRSDSFVKVGNKYANVDGLTGATITTNAVTDAVVAAVKEFRREVLQIR